MIVIINLAYDVSRTTEYIKKSSIDANDILHSLQTMYSVDFQSLIEFMIYLNYNSKELPRIEFDFFKEKANMKLHGFADSPTDEREDEKEDEEQGTFVGYDYQDIEFTNKRRSKLIPILQQQQSDILPFYLPAYPRSVNMEKENENEEMETQNQRLDSTEGDDLNILEIQQKVIESYRRRGKKRKRKSTAEKGSKINPYLRFATES